MNEGEASHQLKRSSQSRWKVLRLSELDETCRHMKEMGVVDVRHQRCVCVLKVWKVSGKRHGDLILEVRELKLKVVYVIEE